MKCFDREQLFAVANHLAAPQEEEAVRSHVAGCAACRVMLAEYQQLNLTLDEWKVADPSPWFDARVRRALDANEAQTSAGGWREFFRMRALAPALLVMVMVVGSLLYVRSHSRQEQPTPKIAQSAASTEVTPQPSAGSGVNAESREEDEVTLYENLSTLEDYDMLANFDVLSELPQGAPKVVN
jgi:hypothetical protein